MPSPKKRPAGITERQRFEILWEEVQSQQKLILAGIAELKEGLERVEFRVGRLEQLCDGFPTAIIANSNELRRFQHDVQVLQHEVAKFGESLQEHLKAHTV